MMTRRQEVIEALTSCPGLTFKELLERCPGPILRLRKLVLALELEGIIRRERSPIVQAHGMRPDVWMIDEVGTLPRLDRTPVVKAVYAHIPQGRGTTARTITQALRGDFSLYSVYSTLDLLHEAGLIVAREGRSLHANKRAILWQRKPLPEAS